MTPPAAKPRLFVTAGLAEGAGVELAAGQAHYLGRVLRLGGGDPVRVFNGRDGEWRARVDRLSRDRGRLTVAQRLRPQGTESGPWLAFAPIKKAAIDFVAAQATELGVSRLWPVFTRNTDVKRVNTERLRANAVEAAQQCGRLSVPEVADPVALEGLIAGWPAGRRLLVADETGGGRPLAEVLSSLAGGPPGGWGVLVGPEGGLARSELDGLGKLAFVTLVGLGPRILRAETAAVATLACLQAWAGDWRPRPPNEAPGSG